MMIDLPVSEWRAIAARHGEMAKTGRTAGIHGECAVLRAGDYTIRHGDGSVASCGPRQAVECCGT